MIRLVLLLGSIAAIGPPTPPPSRPNILMIITDDQGYGDLGIHGNPRLKTPSLDALGRESVRLGSFYVSPVCSPTRASLMTGRDPYRTGVVDTFRGRSMMHPEEVTLAEILAGVGYRTGIFGKWHLGDNAPVRAIDEGFQEALVHQGGGIGQVAGPPGNTYFDPILMHNGREEPSKGYCTEVFADAAMRFVEADRSKPFFAYLAFNAPHEPLQVPESDVQPYRGANPNALPGEDLEITARVYGMVANIDRNVGRVLGQLDRLGLARDTIVVFLTDNGPQNFRYNAGLRGRKSMVHDGGIKAPCFIRWPGKLEAGRVVEPITSVIDLVPTLLAAVGVEKPAGPSFDGRNLLPLLKGEATDWPERNLYVQWHRGDAPEARRAFAVRSSRYKLVQPLGVEPTPLPRPTHYELYDMIADPGEQKDLASRQPDRVESMLRDYDRWFQDVTANRRSEAPRIHLGSDREDPATLTRQDWRGEVTAWEPDGLGGWDVDVLRKARFDITLHFVYGPPGIARIDFPGTSVRHEFGPESRTYRFFDVELGKGPGRLRAWVERPGSSVGVFQLEIHRCD